MQFIKSHFKEHSMRKLLISVALFFAASALGHAQQIDPSNQINWANSTGCSTVGAPYIPQSNTCVPLGTGLVQLNPSAAQVITQPSVSQPLNVNYFSQAFSNGVIFADAFCGLGTIGGIATPSCSADICTKLLAANKYAVANSVTMVDVTHAQGTQACNANPYAGISSGAANSAVNLVNTFGVTHFTINSPTNAWIVTNSNITFHGQGAWGTQVEYTGSTATTAVMTIDGSTGTGTLGSAGIQGIRMDGIYFYGDVSNVTNGLLLKFVNRSRFDSIQVWGVSGCGIQTKGAVTTTFLQPRVSFADALFAGLLGASHTVPTGGICLGGIAESNTGSIDTTSGSVIDPGMEGLTSGIGIHLQSADQETIHGGTSEENLQGIVIDATTSGVNSGISNKFNTIVSMDLEGNTLDTVGVDLTDNGQSNTFINLLSTSSCASSCASVTATGGHSYFLNGDIGVNGAGANGIQIPGFNAAGTCTQTGAYQELINGASVWVMYCSTEP
jgi:hypothetical protein